MNKREAATDGDSESLQRRTNQLNTQKILEARAGEARSRVLAKARSAHWPDSANIGQILGAATAAEGKQQAAAMRAEGKLLGLWSPAEKTFYYPSFQFTADGHIHSKLAALLTALASIPTYAPRDDPTGWGRFDWLTQPRCSLSGRGVAEAAAPGGIALHEELLSRAGRAPSELFALDPDAVIALARADARDMREER